MEDLRRNQAQTHSGCYLKYVIIHIKILIMRILQKMTYCSTFFPALLLNGIY